MASESLNFNLFAKDNASRVFDKVGAAAQGTESKFNRVNRGLAAVGKVAARGAVVFGALGAAGAVMGLKTAASMEQARISFTTMLGSATKADRFLKQLAAFAAKTPFEFPELQTAASSLISAGFHAKEVIPIMTTLGDVTSGMGTGSEGIKRATVALQQMSAAGKITGEDLNQLRDAGVPVFDLLSAATGKSKAAIAALAQQGKLGKTEMQALFDALGSGKGLERFNGLMEKQSASLTGLWSTFKDTLGMGLAKAIEPAIPAIKAGLGQMTSAVGTALNALPGIIAAAKSFAEPIVAKIREALPQILAGFTPVVGQIRSAVVSAFTFTSGIAAAIQSGNWSAVGVAFGEALTKAATGAAGLTKAIRAWIAGVDWMALGKAASAAAVPFIIAFANDLVINFLKFVKSHPMDALTFVLTVIPIGRVAGVLEKVLGGLPIAGPILRAMAGAGGAVEGAAGRLFGLIIRAAEHIAPELTASIRALGDRIAFRVLSWAVDLGAAAASAGRAIVAGVTRPFAGIGDKLVTAGRDLIAGFVRGIGSMFGAVQGKLGELTGKLTSWKGPPERDQMLLYASGQMVIDGFVRGLDAAQGKVRDKLKKITLDIADFFGEGIKASTPKALEAVKSLTDAVTAKLGDLRKKAADVRSTAASAVSGMFSFGDIGATTTGSDADGNPTSSTASPVAQFADFAAKSQAFAGAVSQGVAHGLDPRIVAQAVGTGNLVVVQALAALDPGGVKSVNRDFALAQKLAAQVGQTVLSTTRIPADIAREEKQLEILRDIRKGLNDKDPKIEIHVHGGDPDAVVAAIKTWVRKNGKMHSVAD